MDKRFVKYESIHLKRGFMWFLRWRKNFVYKTYNKYIYEKTVDKLLFV